MLMYNVKSGSKLNWLLHYCRNPVLYLFFSQLSSFIFPSHSFCFSPFSPSLLRWVENYFRYFTFLCPLCLEAGGWKWKWEKKVWDENSYVRSQDLPDKRQQTRHLSPGPLGNGDSLTTMGRNRYFFHKGR